MVTMFDETGLRSRAHGPRDGTDTNSQWRNQQWQQSRQTLTCHESVPHHAAQSRPEKSQPRHSGNDDGILLNVAKGSRLLRELLIELHDVLGQRQRVLMMHHVPHTGQGDDLQLREH